MPGGDPNPIVCCSALTSETLMSARRIAVSLLTSSPLIVYAPPGTISTACRMPNGGGLPNAGMVIASAWLPLLPLPGARAMSALSRGVQPSRASASSNLQETPASLAARFALTANASVSRARSSNPSRSSARTVESAFLGEDGRAPRRLLVCAHRGIGPGDYARYAVRHSSPATHRADHSPVCLRVGGAPSHWRAGPTVIGVFEFGAGVPFRSQFRWSAASLLAPIRVWHSWASAATCRRPAHCAPSGVRATPRACPRRRTRRPWRR